MQRYSDAVQDRQGNALSGVSVLVQTESGSSATIYSDNGSTVAANPLTTDADGEFEFWAADGVYRLTYSGPSVTTETEEVQLWDQRENGAGLAAQINVLDFGADRTGARNSTQAFKDAIAFAKARGGGTIRVPEGLYILRETLVIDSNDISIVGDGMWNTVLRRNLDYGDGIFITGDDTTGTYRRNFEISNLTIESTVLTTSGAHIHCNGIIRVNILNVFLKDGWWGLKMMGVLPALIVNSYITITNLYGGSATNRRLAYFGNAAATYDHPSCADTYITNFNWSGAPGLIGTDIGCEVISSDGLWFENGRMAWTTTASLRFNATSTEAISHCYFSNILFDATEGDGIVFQGDGTNNYGQIYFTNTNLRGGGTGGNALVIAADTPLRNMVFTGGSVIQWTKHGIVVQSTKLGKVSFTGTQVSSCSWNNVGTYSCASLSTGVKNVSFVGGRYGGRLVLGDPNETTGDTIYGINIPATCNNIVVSGVDVSLNRTAGISVAAGVGPNVRITGCIDESASQTVASANSISVPAVHDVVKISGTTTINTIVARPSQSRLVLIFTDACTVSEAGNIKLSAAFTSTADDTLSLVCDGTTWYETARSVN